MARGEGQGGSGEGGVARGEWHGIVRGVGPIPERDFVSLVLLNLKLDFLLLIF